MPDKDTTPPDHTDLSELREEVLKTGTVKKAMVTFSQKIFSNDTASPVAVKSQDIVEIGIDDLMQLFKQYAQPPVVADEELDEILDIFRHGIVVDATGSMIKGDSKESAVEISNRYQAAAKAALLQREQRLVAAAERAARISEHELWLSKFEQKNDVAILDWSDERLAQLNSETTAGEDE